MIEVAAAAAATTVSSDWLSMLYGHPNRYNFRRATFLATSVARKVCKLLLQIAGLWSKAKVSKLFSQLFAPIKSVHEKSCEKSLETFTFLATLCSHKNRSNRGMLRRSRCGLIFL